MVTQGEILKQYGRMILKDPRSYVFVSMADSCYRAGRYKMALKILDKGLRVRPGLACALTAKGRVLAALGRKDEAIKVLMGVAASNGENLLSRKLLKELDGFPDPNGKETPEKENFEWLKPVQFDMNEAATTMSEDELATFGLAEQLFPEPSPLAQLPVEQRVAQLPEPIMPTTAEPLVPVADIPTQTGSPDPEGLEAILNIGAMTFEPLEKEIPRENSLVTLSTEPVSSQNGSLFGDAEISAILSNIVDGHEKETDFETGKTKEENDPAVITLEKWLDNASRMMKG